MSELTIQEQSLLRRVISKPELKPRFFQKVDGLKWFKPLMDEGFFEPQNIPVPHSPKNDGYYQIKRWEVCEYLLKVSRHLDSDTEAEYSPLIYEIIQRATAYARGKEFSNYQTWWQFARMLKHIPVEYIQDDVIDMIDYWIKDPFERGLTAQELGTKWLTKLFDTDTEQSKRLATQLLDTLFSLKFDESKSKIFSGIDSSFYIEKHYAEEIVRSSSYEAGKHLGNEAVDVFATKLREILTTLNNDSWSAIWQPAIEKHDQNNYRDDPDNILIVGLRESLNGYWDADQVGAVAYLEEMLAGDYDTLKRVAIHTISAHYSDWIIDNEDPLVADYFNVNLRHEVWHFLNKNYQSFNQPTKEKVLNIITSLQGVADEEHPERQVTSDAYERALWLSAIEGEGEQEQKLYSENVEICGCVPDHPDFSSYTSVGWRKSESKYDLGSLNSLSSELLVELFEKHTKDQTDELESLSGIFKTMIKSSPERFFSEFKHYLGLDLCFIHAFVEAYRDLWTEQSKLPWDNVWGSLLNGINQLVSNSEFWQQKNFVQRELFIANGNWLISSIGGLLESAVKTDNHAVNEKYNSLILEIILAILNHVEGSEFSKDSDAVSIAINSPRGQAIEALINLALRECRLKDKQNNKDHSEVWIKFEPIFDDELVKVNDGIYEFATLVTNYMPNFLYMSRQWFISKLEVFFNSENELQWLCAIQGYSHVSSVYKDIYEYLRDHGHFERALRDSELSERIDHRIIEQAVVAYIEGYEGIKENDFLLWVIELNQVELTNRLIWCFWVRRENPKVNWGLVFPVFKAIFNVIDLKESWGKNVASHLCDLTHFIDSWNDEIKSYVLEIAPYADESFNSHDLLKFIAKISKENPSDATEIWLAMLTSSHGDYPEDAVKEALVNIYSAGKRMAKDVVDAYSKLGVYKPYELLRNISSNQADN